MAPATQVVERIVGLACRVAEQAEVYAVSSSSTPVSFEANRLKQLTGRETSGFALRLVKNGRIGFSATNDPEDIESLIGRAMELSQFGAEAKFEFPGVAAYPSIKLFDKAADEVSIERMIELGQGMIDTVLKENAELILEARVSKSVASLEIMNSKGGHAHYQKSMFGLGVDGNLVRGTDMLFVGEHRAHGSPIFDTVPITDKVISQLRLASCMAQAPQGQVSVILSPGAVASIIVHPLTMALNGRTVLQGSSPLGAKLGQQLFDPRISLWDDPTIDLQPGSHPADDEAVPTRRKALIEKGRVNMFFYDLQTAAISGAQSTGNAQRSLGSPPHPSTSLLVLEAGDTKLADMISGISEGLFIEDLLGAGQGNILGGEVSGNVLLGYRIQNGELVGRVKDTLIAGNVYDILKKVIAIGSEPEWVGGGLCAPHVAINGLTVSRKG